MGGGCRGRETMGDEWWKRVGVWCEWFVWEVLVVGVSAYMDFTGFKWERHGS